MENLEQTLREAIANKTAKVLTVNLATELKGRKIATLYFGHRGQDGFDEFVIGNVVSEYAHAESITEGFEKEGNQARRWDAVMSASQVNRYKNTMILLTADGRNTFIRAHEENHGAFTCSDTDRFVYFIESGNADTSKPKDAFYKNGKKLDEVVINGYFEAQSGFRFYNLYASYDAKLNIETGESWVISHPDYNSVSFPTINDLLEKGLLIDHNYGK